VDRVGVVIEDVLDRRKADLERDALRLWMAARVRDMGKLGLRMVVSVF
jgi:hypothetical protein